MDESTDKKLSPDFSAPTGYKCPGNLICQRFPRRRMSGVVICEKHGRGGAVETCPHAAETIEQGSYHHFHRLQIFGDLLVCEECLHKYELAEFERYPSYFTTEHPDPEFDAAVDAYAPKYEQVAGKRVFCSECIAAAEIAQARRDGRPDPFPVYERTLTANHSGALEDLKKHLTANFEFRYSIVNAAERAFFVSGGNYRRPMTVKIYYVTKASEQDFIASLIENFVAASTLNQAEVVFLEAEVWTPWSNPATGMSGHCRGKETILREILMNYP